MLQINYQDEIYIEWEWLNENDLIYVQEFKKWDLKNKYWYWTQKDFMNNFKKQWIQKNTQNNTGKIIKNISEIIWGAIWEWKEKLKEKKKLNYKELKVWMLWKRTKTYITVLKNWYYKKIYIPKWLL